MAKMVTVDYGNGRGYQEAACDRCANGLTSDGLGPGESFRTETIPMTDGLVCDFCGDYADGTDNPNNY